MFNHQITTTSTTRRRRVATGIGVALGLGLSTIAAGSAAAEQPIKFADSFSFDAENPCTGEGHRVSIDIEGRFVDHGDDTGVVHFKRSGTTSDGFTMRSGNETLRRNRNGVEFGNFNDVWTSDDGSKFQARGSFRYDYVNNELLGDSFTLRCITN